MATAWIGVLHSFTGPSQRTFVPLLGPVRRGAKTVLEETSPHEVSQGKNAKPQYVHTKPRNIPLNRFFARVPLKVFSIHQITG